ncbi:hypothetical protein Tco_0218620 [Tanacetum coccineum]
MFEVCRGGDGDRWFWAGKDLEYKRCLSVFKSDMVPESSTCYCKSSPCGGERFSVLADKERKQKARQITQGQKHKDTAFLLARAQLSSEIVNRRGGRFLPEPCSEPVLVPALSLSYCPTVLVPARLSYCPAVPALSPCLALRSESAPHPRTTLSSALQECSSPEDPSFRSPCFLSPVGRSTAQAQVGR